MILHFHEAARQEFIDSVGYPIYTARNRFNKFRLFEMTYRPCNPVPKSKGTRTWNKLLSLGFRNFKDTSKVIFSFSGIMWLAIPHKLKIWEH